MRLAELSRGTGARLELEPVELGLLQRRLAVRGHVLPRPLSLREERTAARRQRTLPVTELPRSSRTVTRKVSRCSRSLGRRLDPAGVPESDLSLRRKSVVSLILPLASGLCASRYAAGSPSSCGP
jgi:hypothetical protein